MDVCRPSPLMTLSLSGCSLAKPSDQVVLLLNARLVHKTTMFIHGLIKDEGANRACIAETWVNKLGVVLLTLLCPLQHSQNYIPVSEFGKHILSHWGSSFERC